MPELGTMEAVLTALTFTPKIINEPTGWVPHIPFAATLVRATEPRLIVELGTHSGNSYFAFCQAVDEFHLPTLCYAVDTWQGDPQAGTYDDSVYKQVSNYNRANYSRFSYLLRITFDEAVLQFDDKSIDILHIDGLHTYDAVKHDFETWLPKVRPGGVILFHDICVRHGDFGVWRLWNEIKNAYPYTLTLSHAYGLGILVKDEYKDGAHTFLKQLTAKFGEIFWQCLYAKSGEQLLSKTHVEKSRLLYAQAFASVDSHFSEVRSEKIAYEPNKTTVLRFASLSQAVGKGNIYLRIDPTEQSGDVQIRRITILNNEKNGTPEIIRNFDLYNDVTLNDGTIRVGGKSLSLFTPKTDPQIHLAPFELNCDTPWVLEVEIISDPTMTNMSRWLVEQYSLVESLQNHKIHLERQITHELSEMDSLKERLAHKEDRIIELEGQVRQIEGALHSRESALLSQLNTSKQNIEEKEAMLKASLGSLIEKNEMNTAMEIHMDSIKKQSAQLQKNLAALQQELNARNQRIEASTKEIEHLKREINERQSEHESRETISGNAYRIQSEELSAIKSSLSWRITSPLRFFKHE